MGNFSPQTKSRAFIATIHIENMKKAGLQEAQYTNPQHLANFLTALWNNSGKNRTSAVAVCESKTECYHAHMALYGNTTTLKNVAKILFNSHVEPQLSGKKELSSYLLKEGKYADKNEKILYVHGIENIQEQQGNRSDLDFIEEMLVNGMTPQEILNTNFKYYRYENMILHAYLDMRLQNAPIRQEIYCEYHIGDSGTGKTYTYECLCKEKGINNIYLLTDYDNNASGGLDAYMKLGAPPILFMDEFKGHGISYEKLLVMLNGYSRMQTHSRYVNTYNLWNTVYITSIYPPERLYQNMVATEHQDIDSFKQLMRRINKIVYHFKENDNYKIYSIKSENYIDYKHLQDLALKHNTEHDFHQLSKEEQLHFPF